MINPALVKGEGLMSASADRRGLLLLCAGPLIGMIFLFSPTPDFMPPLAFRMLGVVIWMVLWWLSEVIPLPATALLPVPLLPAFDILPIGQVTAAYGHKFIFLFLGGFLIAAGMERWGLHKRIALNVIARFGAGPGAIVAGFMTATAFLSMWISNTATAIMMYAVGVSLIRFLLDKAQDKAALRGFAIALLLGIAYSASIGGAGTLIGTAPNAFLAGYLEETHNISIAFIDWMKVGVPVVLIMVPAAWFLLTRVIYPLQDLTIEGSEALVRDELSGLGPMKPGERAVLITFSLAAFLWVFGKQLAGFVGLPISDTGIAIGAAIMLFAWPLNLRERKFVLSERELQSIPWGILILLGGGIALAQGMKASGLAAFVGDGVAGFGVQQWSLIALGALMIVFLTELTSNTASTTTFAPVFGAVAISAGLDPVLSTLPIAIGASMAFMMPVATPPNAIVFAYPDLHIIDMVRAGFWLNLIAVAVCFSAVYFLAPFVFS